MNVSLNEGRNARLSVKLASLNGGCSVRECPLPCVSGGADYVHLHPLRDARSPKNAHTNKHILVWAFWRTLTTHRTNKQPQRLQSLGYWEQLHCPQPLGFRPSFHPVQEVGSACEAWVQRGAQFVLSRVLSGNMHGLEWSAGSSTRFYLLWLASLHSVEHDAGWAAIVERQIRTELPHAATAAWRFDRVAANASFRGERKAFQAYVNVPLQRAKYDFVSVDGRARGRCLDRVRVDRLVRRGGIVMLDNSKREKYAAARRAFDRMGWARVEFDSTARTKHANGSVRHRPVPHMATTLWCRGAERDDNQGMGMRHTVVLK